VAAAGAPGALGKPGPELRARPERSPVIQALKLPTLRWALRERDLGVQRLD
jgi:hypothetical protein